MKSANSNERGVLPALLAIALLATGCMAEKIDRTSGAAIDRQWMIETHLSRNHLDPIEGVWAWGDDEFELAIVRNHTTHYKGYDYIGIVTESRDFFTEPGEIKLALKASASPMAFPGVCRCPGNWTNSDRMGTTFLLGGTEFLTFSYELYPDRLSFRLVRTFPREPRAAATPTGWLGSVSAPGGSGSGFFVAPDLVATSAHVIEGAQRIWIHREQWRWPAERWLSDPRNDVAVLRVGAPERIHSAGSPASVERQASGFHDPDGPRRLAGEALPEITCLALRADSPPAAGERLFSMGYPLGGLLGDEPHIGEGIVTSTYGLHQARAIFQMSNPIQPGQSGGPLFDRTGRVVGIVTGSLSPALGGGQRPLVPQNANFAVKASELARLLGAADPSECGRGQPGAKGALSASEAQRLLSPAVVRVAAEF